jgi:ATP-dependent RNA helicase DeaD
MNDPAQEKEVSFSDFHLLPEILEAVEKMGFKTPTPVQARTYKCAMSGNDFIAMAQTGTGKTAAFGIPIIQKIDPKGAVQALILAPTRELALQVSKEIACIGQKRGIRCAAVYGGASFTAQTSDVKSGAQIVAGTPGRVLDHIRRRTISFDSLKVLVLDEADEMLSMGFEKELSEIMEALPRKRQTMLFSATIPDDIQRLSKRYMGEAEIISVSDDGVAAKDVSHFVYVIPGHKRHESLVKIIEVERPESAIVFCNTREETQFVAQFLKNKGYNADWLNSDLSQNDRERVMKATRNGTLKFLVATDVAARGIDVSLLSHVINYTFPESLEVYVHRTGRTGRAGRQGAAVSLIAPQDIGSLYMLRLTYKIFPVEKKLITETETAKMVELERIGILRKTFANGEGAGFEGLAKRLMCDVRGEKIVAGLIGRYFGEARDEAGEEGRTYVSSEKVSEAGDSWTAAANRPMAVSESSDDPASDTPLENRKFVSSPFDAEPFDARNAAKDNAEYPDESIADLEQNVEIPTRKLFRDKEERDDNQGEDREEVGEKGEIYLNAGRKDGLHISALMKIVMQRTGLPRTALGKVRMLTRSTFVSVPEEYFDLVLKALANVEVDGIKLQAEPAGES